MKKLFSVLIALVTVLLLTPAIFAQSTGYIKHGAGVEDLHPAVFQKMYCVTEGDYVITVAGTAADTSAVYKVPPYEEVWLISKPSGQAADSIDQVVWVDIKTTNLISSALNDGVGWKSGIDSSKVVTADTLYGVYKELTFPPADYCRVRLAGVTGNDASTGSTCEIWLVFKQ